MYISTLFGKVVDALIHDELIKHLTSHYLLSDEQYGFRFSRLTAVVLTAITEFIYHAVDKIDEARAVVLDCVRQGLTFSTFPQVQGLLCISMNIWPSPIVPNPCNEGICF